MSVTLHLGDCLDFMRTLPAGSVDAVITDPPYSSGGSFRSDRTNSTASKYLGSYGSTTAGKLGEVIGDSRDALGWAFWATLWASAAYNVVKVGGFCLMFSDWRQLPNATNVLQAAGFVWRGIAVWDKGGSVRPMSGRFAHQAEYVLWGTKGPIPWDYSKPWHKGVFTSGSVSSKERNHQTEKPTDVMKWLIEITDEGQTILDPFMGSGTTGVACVQTGHNFIGCEIDPGYFEIARKRIAQAQAQPSLLEAIHE
jgi:site-specific DNA-methyltransferase (adenine-specific)